MHRSAECESVWMIFEAWNRAQLRGRMETPVIAAISMFSVSWSHSGWNMDRIDSKPPPSCRGDKVLCAQVSTSLRLQFFALKIQCKVRFVIFLNCDTTDWKCDVSSIPKRMALVSFVSGWNLHHISNQLCHSFKNDKANFALDFQGEKMKPQRRAYLSSENFVSSARWRLFRFYPGHRSHAVASWHKKHG